MASVKDGGSQSSTKDVTISDVAVEPTQKVTDNAQVLIPRRIARKSADRC